MPAQSRVTVKVDEISGLEATSAVGAVVVVRPGTAARGRAHDVLGCRRTTAVTPRTPCRSRRRAGSSRKARRGFFDTFLLLANPNAGDVDATVTFLRENESPVTDTITLAGEFAHDGVRRRRTRNSSIDRSASIVDAPQPITAERAMYFATTPERFWSGGHANIGSVEPATSWFHPEGASGTFFTTFILMSNPQHTPRRT